MNQIERLYIYILFIHQAQNDLLKHTEGLSVEILNTIYALYCMYCSRVPAAKPPGCTASEGLLYKPWSLVVPTCTARCLHQRI